MMKNLRYFALCVSLLGILACGDEEAKIEDGTLSCNTLTCSGDTPICVITTPVTVQGPTGSNNYTCTETPSSCDNGPTCACFFAFFPVTDGLDNCGCTDHQDGTLTINCVGQWGHG